MKRPGDPGQHVVWDVWRKWEPGGKLNAKLNLTTYQLNNLSEPEHVQWVAEEYGLEQKLPQDLRRAWLSPAQNHILHTVWSTGGVVGLILHFLEIRH